MVKSALKPSCSLSGENVSHVKRKVPKIPQFSPPPLKTTVRKGYKDDFEGIRNLNTHAIGRGSRARSNTTASRPNIPLFSPPLVKQTVPRDHYTEEEPLESYHIPTRNYLTKDAFIRLSMKYGVPRDQAEINWTISQSGDDTDDVLLEFCNRK